MSDRRKDCSKMALTRIVVALLSLVSLCCRVDGLKLGELRRSTRGAIAAITGSFFIGCLPLTAFCDENMKLLKLPPAEIGAIVAKDITERQALVTADFTRAIYSENCEFQDEIDTYKIDEYVRGTKALFNDKLSHVDLVPDSVVATDDAVQFKFKETLAFNIPFNPKVTLSGRVELTRSKDDGLIVYSREYWDQSVSDVIRTAKF
jgi:hypothetical protein